eukprot:8404439-Ditylum_brightwellii.AAC.1
MQPERRRSQRHAAAQLDEQKIFGKDYGQTHHGGEDCFASLSFVFGVYSLGKCPMNFFCTTKEKKVPLGFICGYPVGNGGELYGGSMFIRSAAADTLQGQAIQKINTRWGADFRRWDGMETIGIP